MTPGKHLSFVSLFLIIVVCANLLNVQSVRADGETPTEPPAATEVVTELPPPTELPAEPQLKSTPVPAEADVPNENDLSEAPSLETVPDENTPVTGILANVPEETSVVVLDEAGQPLALGSQETADAVIDSDPVWCPASVTAPTPGANGCSNSYPTITDLLTAMRTQPTAFDENGTIFLEKPTGQGFTTPLILNDSATSLSSAFSTLSAFELTIQGGWNKDNPGTFSGQTNFGAGGGNQGYILIGSATNPWVGNVSLYDLHISYASVANGVTVYTTTGSITLHNVDVDEQSGVKYTGYLTTNSGNIVVEDSSFNGSNQGQNRNRGFYAETNTGSISITGSGDYTFQDAIGTDPANHNGATLSAPTVTLTNVISRDNDGNGIEIRNASTVTLNNVMAGPNINNEGNDLSGVLINGTGSTVVNVFGGVFADNGTYGIEVLNGSLYFKSAPTCPSGNTSNGSGCYNIAPTTDMTAPVITPTVSGTSGSGGWYTSNVTVSWSVIDTESAVSSSTGCGSTTISADTTGTVLTCSATSMGGTSSQSVTIRRDATMPSLVVPSDINVSSSVPTVVSYAATATDNLVASPSVTCMPASGSTFALGTTTVNCSASDAAGNAASGSFQVTVTSPVVVPTTPPAPTAPAPTPAPSLSAGTASENNSSAVVIPSTGAGLLDLGCNRVLWAFGIKVSFINLCDQQTELHSVGADALPAKLPDGFSFVMGLDVDILSDGQTVETLPEGTGIQMDFPTGSDDEFTVVNWDEDKAEWIEASLELDHEKVSQAVSSGDELYHLVNEHVSGQFCQALTTDKTGIFVLVKK